MTPIAMTIAGSDSAGSAGIAADFKTFAALGVHGTAAITALTAQNSVEVSEVKPVECEFIAKQIETVFSDMTIGAVKTGMLATAEIVEAVTDTLLSLSAKNIVVDPVIFSTSNRRLITTEGMARMTMKLLPIATVVTPNAPEAEAFTGLKIVDVSAMKMAATIIAGFGPKNVLIKGGHVKSEKVTDVLYDGKDFHLFERDRIDTNNTRGSGCALSAAITAGLAKGLELAEAISTAQKFIERAIAGSYKVGKGAGPVNPMAWCEQDEE